METSSKSHKVVVDNNKQSSKNVNKLIKLSLQYVDKLTEVEKIRPVKLKFASKSQWDKAAIEKSKENKALIEAGVIFKKMKKVRKLIKE